MHGVASLLEFGSFMCHRLAMSLAQPSASELQVHAWPMLPYKLSATRFCESPDAWERSDEYKSWHPAFASSA